MPRQEECIQLLVNAFCLIIHYLSDHSQNILCQNKEMLALFYLKGILKEMHV